MPSPCLNEDLCFSKRVEDLGIEQLVSELAVEAFIVAILPWASWLDEERFNANLRQPFPYGYCRELRPIVRADVIRWTTINKETGQAMKHIV